MRTTYRRSIFLGIAAAILGTLGLAATAQAQPVGPTWSERQWDQRRWDQQYDRSYRPTYMSPRAARLFARLDRNNDGVLARWEVRRSAFSRRFRQMDRNDDGMIGPREFNRAYRRLARRGVDPYYARDNTYRYELRLGL
jgi:hypothetical protein